MEIVDVKQSMDISPDKIFDWSIDKYSDRSMEMKLSLFYEIINSDQPTNKTADQPTDRPGQKESCTSNIDVSGHVRTGCGPERRWEEVLLQIWYPRQASKHQAR